MQLWITTEFAGRLIGKGGTRITEIRRQSGATLKVEKDQQGGWRPAFIGGTTAQVLACLEAALSDDMFEEGSMTEVNIVVPSESIGRVIGKGGSNAEKVRQTSGAQVQIEKTPPGQQAPTRLVECRGTGPQLRSALAQIYELMGEEGGQHPSQNGHHRDHGGSQFYGQSPGGKGMYAPIGGNPRPARPSTWGAPMAQDHSGKGFAPDWGGGKFGGGKGGFSCGGCKGGVKGGYPGEYAGAYVADYGNHGDYGAYGGYGGYSDAVAPLAPSMGNNAGKRGRQEDAMPPSGVLIFEMPNEIAGSLIGKAGATITNIRRTSGARFQIKEGFRLGGGERVVTIDGDEEQVDTCVTEVFRVLQESGRAHQDGHLELTLVLQSTQMGAIIGKGGTTIERIRHESGARIIVDKADGRMKDTTRTAVVSGAFFQVCEALRKVAGTLFQENKTGDHGQRQAFTKRQRGNEYTL